MADKGHSDFEIDERHDTRRAVALGTPKEWTTVIAASVMPHARALDIATNQGSGRSERQRESAIIASTFI